MYQGKDNFTWTDQLECPLNICNDNVKKRLSKGFLGLLWDEMSNAIYSQEEIIKTRKNILLYRLKNNYDNSSIECLKTISQMKLERNRLDSLIFILEKEYENRNFLLQQKILRLRDAMSLRMNVQTQINILKMKCNDTNIQIQDCALMLKACKQLMPNNSKELNEQKIKESLETVVTLCDGANKREVRNNIFAKLGSMDIPSLWAYLYQIQAQNMEVINPVKQKKLGILNTSNAIGENIEIGIARAYSQHIVICSKKLLYNAKVKQYQQNLIDFIEQIEGSAKNTEEISEWLALTLEVHKLKMQQQSLQSEIENIKENCFDNNSIITNIVQITSEIQNIDLTMETCIHNIQKSLCLLKSAPSLIFVIKDKLNNLLQKISRLRVLNNETPWINIDLINELNIFYNKLDINALRKVPSKGKFGSGKYSKFCLSEARINLEDYPKITRSFPIICLPMYFLIQCYKIMTLNGILKNMNDMELENIELSNNDDAVNYDYQQNIMELLNSSRSICENARNSIEQFNVIEDAWSKQTVESAMDIVEHTVYGATYKEWHQRFNALIFMLQNLK